MKHNQLVSISKGNRKLGGVMNISTSPRNVVLRASLARAKDATHSRPIGFIPAPARHGAGTSASPSVILIPISCRLRHALPRHKPRLFRWHVAGDILSTDYLRGMCRVAACESTNAFSRVHQGLRYRQPLRRPRGGARQPGDRILGLAGDDGSTIPTATAWPGCRTERKPAYPRMPFGVLGTVRPVACAMSCQGWAAM